MKKILVSLFVCAIVLCSIPASAQSDGVFDGYACHKVKDAFRPISFFPGVAFWYADTATFPEYVSCGGSAFAKMTAKFLCVPTDPDVLACQFTTSAGPDETCHYTSVMDQPGPILCYLYKCLNETKGRYAPMLGPQQDGTLEVEDIVGRRAISRVAKIDMICTSAIVTSPTTTSTTITTTSTTTSTTM